MFIRCERLLDGPGPSDVIVAIHTVDGQTVEVVVDKRSLHGDSLDVAVIGKNSEGNALIELPREASSGQGRVWVPYSELRELQAAE